jgi:hypothetical protein
MQLLNKLFNQLEIGWLLLWSNGNANLVRAIRGFDEIESDSESELLDHPAEVGTHELDGGR